MPGTVSQSEREQANRIERDRASIERRGVVQARRVSFAAVQAVLRAYRQNRNIVPVLIDRMDEAVPYLADVMTLAHLKGREREIEDAPVVVEPATLSLDIARTREFRDLVETSKRRLGMTDQDISETARRYQVKASQVITETRRHVETKLQAALARVTAEGLNRRQAVLELTAAFAKAGIEPDNAFMVENLFRTHTQIAYSAGRWQADQDPVIAEIHWGYKYVTVGDDRVRPEHVGFDGVVLPKDDPFWDSNMPPNGWSCRCTVISLYTERQLVRPEPVDVDGRIVMPEVDEGFRWNPGKRYPDKARVTEFTR